MSDDLPAVLDLRPLIKRKQAAECEHRHASVDETAAVLTCEDCGVELDPWWFLRQLAHHEEERRAELASYKAQVDAYLASAREKIDRYQREITQLLATKNRLWNEQVNDRPLGSLVGRRKNR